MRSRNGNRRARRSSASLSLACLFAAAVGSTGGWAYTAANSLASSGRAGQGAAAINAYAISGVAYTLNVNSPQNIDQAKFSLAPAAAGTVQARLATGGSWFACTNSAGTVTCSTTSPQANATTANNLTIAAAQ
jgi:hypothetical protein